MDIRDYQYIGKITKTSGYQGNLMFLFDPGVCLEYEKIHFVFIRLNWDVVPFLVEEISPGKGTSALVKLDGVGSFGEASALVNCEVYLPLEDLPKVKSAATLPVELAGFEVIDREKGSVGKVRRVFELSGQPLLEISSGDKTFLVPAVKAILRKTDKKNRKLHIEAPEGLIDLYQ
jgi:16S rRNA processing protein RimM